MPMGGGNHQETKIQISLTEKCPTSYLYTSTYGYTCDHFQETSKKF